MPSWSAEAVRFYISHFRRTKKLFGNAKSTHDSIEDLYFHPESFSPPSNHGNDIILHREDVNGWPLYRVSRWSAQGKEDSAKPRGALLYIHGGAFYREIDPFHWKFIYQTASETGLDVLVPIYPLIPRPAATASQVIPALVDICRNVKQDIISISGDSAGGGIALATMHHMLDAAPELAKKIRSIVLISPVLDITFRHPEIERLEKTDPWLATEGLKVITPLWSAGTSTTDPIVSPLHGDITRLPPVLLLCGTDDILNADARRLSAKFQGKGCDECIAGSIELGSFTYVEKAKMIHVYPILPHWEGSEARKLIMEFIQKHSK
ncbi:hypothetical protein SVAN01_08153 [Stagonosporopsis vannaccii]|nr:hypothetical protein SVAN01_08153 [Stagonosporopsis vannaccii]